MNNSAYPKNLVHERRLFDGRTVTIRPIRADDAERMREFLVATSAESLYKRFQKWVHAPSNNLIHFLTDVDYDRQMALVCSVARGDEEELVGEARYGASPGARGCEFGIIIKDSWRKTGIAGLLMESLIRTARDRGFDFMEGMVLATNTVMLRFARALGFAIDPMGDDPRTVRIVMKLKPDHSTEGPPGSATRMRVADKARLRRMRCLMSCCP